MWKRIQLEKYADTALTPKQHPKLDAAERIKRRGELIKNHYFL